MAKRRMFSQKITDTDAFIDMPISAQALYFHLNMHADDDGFVSSPKKIMRMIKASDDDYKILIAKRFVITFESGVCVIKHWLVHNMIRKDRYTETMYLEEKDMLETKDNQSYTENWQPNGNQMAPQVRLGKVREGKESINKNTYGEMEKVKLTEEEYTKLVERFGEQNTKVLIFELDTYVASTGKRYKSHYATLLNWAKRKYDEKITKTNTRKIV